MNAIASWNGGKANLLRQALRMTNEQFADHLGIAVRTVAYWRKLPEMTPLPATQEILDVALAKAADREREQFRLLLAEETTDQADKSPAPPLADRIPVVTAWILNTNVSDETISAIDESAVSLAEAHIHTQPRRVLADVMNIQRRTQTLLMSGRQRLRQTRELMRINSNLLAHACVLLGDVGHGQVAAELGALAVLFASEADTDQAVSWSARAKTARWQGKYGDAADMARRGFDTGRLPTTRLELAYRESLAAALLGDVARSREALARAETTADSLPPDDPHISVWSFPVERQAVFGLAVAIHTGDPDTALRSVAMADAGWAAGDPRNLANWAQIRIGAGMAYLMKDALDGAVEQIIPVLDLHPSLRIDTVTGYLRTLDRRLDQPRFSHNSAVMELRQQIRDFNSEAMNEQYPVEAE